MNEVVGVISLGCAKNLVDTERMLGLLLKKGYSFTNEPAAADILIVNTCGFILSAKQESIDTLLSLARYKKKGGKCRCLVATGCMTELYGKQLAEAMPEIDIVLGIHDYQKLPALLEGRAANDSAAPLSCGSARVLCTPPYRAFLRIADGCDNRCAYCAIPLIRGKLKSDPMELLLAEANTFASNGVTELTVIAQDTSCYGRDLYGEPKLSELLKKLSEIEALKWIRLLYTYPDTVSPKLIDEIAENPKVVNYLDMPLQHASDKILARMNRRGTREHIEMLMKHIEQNAPYFILRTTMMVGFPGETDADFADLLAFLREHPFDRVGAFTFSPEDGTRAAEMPGQVDEAVKKARLDQLMTQQQGISKARAERRAGRNATLLVEGFDPKSSETLGRTEAEAPDVDGLVCIPYKKEHQIGRYLPVRLVKALDYDMIGEEI